MYIRHALVGGIAALMLAASPVAASTTLFRDSCTGPDVLLGSGGPQNAPDPSAWETSSGSLSRRDGRCVPSTGTFRAHTKAVFRNSKFSARWYLSGWNTTDPASAPGSPPQYGALVMARWKSLDELYYIAIERRPDQLLNITKKLPIPGCVPAYAVQCGTYHGLGKFPLTQPERIGSWNTIRVEVANTADDTAVRFRVWINGHFVGVLWDDGSHGRVLTEAGSYGFRSDNALWRWDDVVVTDSLPAPKV